MATRKRRALAWPRCKICMDIKSSNLQGDWRWKFGGVGSSSSMQEINYWLRKANSPVLRGRWRGATWVRVADLESERLEWQEMMCKERIGKMKILSVYSPWQWNERKFRALGTCTLASNRHLQLQIATRSKSTGSRDARFSWRFESGDLQGNWRRRLWGVRKQQHARDQLSIEKGK